MDNSQLVEALGDDQAAEVFSGSQVAFVLTDPRLEDNPIVYVNKAFEQLTGYSRNSACLAPI